MKYTSLDSRTGYVEGKVVELTLEELNKLPFNVFMKAEKEKKSDEQFKKEQEDIEKTRATVALNEDLLRKGLSSKRTQLVVKKYGNMTELMKHVGKAGIDSITDDFIKNNYTPLSEKSKKRIANLTEDLRDDGKRNYSNKKKKDIGGD